MANPGRSSHDVIVGDFVGASVGETLGQNPSVDVDVNTNLQMSWKSRLRLERIGQQHGIDKG